jgi:adenylosuccinate synthase
VSETRYASVLGLGFGDCGKGHFIDALTRRWQAHSVVRFNGGAQAGHNVLTPTPPTLRGVHHTFSQWGAGTFVPGVQTLLLDPTVVHPTALLSEAEQLARVGVPDALSRLSVDGQCRVTTPFHQSAGRLREVLRGVNAHGTCGVGVGETVRHCLEHPSQAVRYADLAQTHGTATKFLLERLQAIRETLLAEFRPHGPPGSPAETGEDFHTLQDETLASRWLRQAQAVARHCPPESADRIHHRLHQPGCVLFEGAQGVLLDEWHGFHPHTTWSSINAPAVESVARQFGITAPIDHYGVLRTYLTRHGAGPLPTQDDSLDALLPEPHNLSDGCQGRFRRGHPDAVLWRYALQAVGQLRGLLVSHLDVFQQGVGLKWCDAYAIEQVGGGEEPVDQLRQSQGRDLGEQFKLTQLLQNVKPRYHPLRMVSDDDFLRNLATITSLPVIFGSYGPSSTHLREL